MKIRLWGWMLICILSAATYGFAQSATTSLQGYVKDPSGALVPGATVKLTNNATGISLTTVSNNAGLYAFPQIRPAKYTITVTAAGFGEQSKSAELLVNQPATIDFTLTVQSSSVTVDVSATAQTLNLTDATIGNSVGNATIEQMPMDGRDPVSLLSLQPGVLFLGQVNSLDDSRQGAVAGSRSDQGNVTLDGIDNNDQLTGKAFSGVLRSTMDSTEEFRVTTSNANADAGRSAGAQVTLVTKSGTNKYHGALYEYYRAPNTVANDWFLKNLQIDSGEPNKPDHYVQNVFGGSLGGPIKKDKLFFFFNYEGLRRAINDTATRTVPTAPFYNTGATDNVIGYENVDGGTTWLTYAQLAELDSGCQTCAAAGINPGANPYVQQFFSTIPTIQPGQGAAYGDGINSGGYTFSSPRPFTQNTTILKLDWAPSASSHIFARGNLQKDTDHGDEQYPGQGASSTRVDNSKGMAFGYTWNPNANMVNDIRYGYVRQGFSDLGIAQGDYIDFRFYDDPAAVTRNTITHVPVHNITDNFTLTKGTHTISIGGDWRMVTNDTVSDGNSFQSASTNPYWLNADPPSPTTIGLPDVSDAFSNSWLIAYTTLVGAVPELDGQFNYEVTSPTTATRLADGTPQARSFRQNEFEYYVQDSWRIRPNLAVTFGLRHTLLQTPYEMNGQQVAPTIDTNSWFRQRETAAMQGQVYEPLLEFAPAGKGNNAPAYWPKQKNNFAPRVSIVYSPDSKTSIRAGAGIFFDHFGQALVNSFNQYGSFGLNTSLSNPAASYGPEDAPRFTGVHNLPDIPLNNPPGASQTFPYAPPEAFAITWGINNRIKTPYSESLDFSIQRELPGGFTAEVAYVGRMGRHLLQQLDLAEPVNYNDPQGGGTYFQAGAELSKISDENDGCYIWVDSCPPVDVPTIQYFEDVFPGFKNFDYDGESATAAIYNNEWAWARYGWGATTALADIDFPDYCQYWYGPGVCNDQSLFWQPQFSSLYAWSSIGNSSYNAAQLTIRHPQSHGLMMDLNYTYSKSIDMGSLTERASEFSNDVGGGGVSAIQNTWNPSANRAVSDFDVRHLITYDWTYQLPFGTGKAVLGNSGRLANAIIGGWQWAGIGRWSSGLPFSLYEPGWTTDWQLSGAAVITDPSAVKISKHILKGQPQAFAGNTAHEINANITSGNPVRIPYPGEAGQRNYFRGDGFINLDSSLTKSWNVAEMFRMKFAWEVYNITNTPRFDVATMNTNITSASMGYYGTMLTQYRRMQFGLRLDF